MLIDILIHYCLFSNSLQIYLYGDHSTYADLKMLVIIDILEAAKTFYNKKFFSLAHIVFFIGTLLWYKYWEIKYVHMN